MLVPRFLRWTTVDKNTLKLGRRACGVLAAERLRLQYNSKVERSVPLDKQRRLNMDSGVLTTFARFVHKMLWPAQPFDPTCSMLWLAL